MKILHCADIHLGSQMDTQMPRDRVALRRAELRDTLRRTVEYAKENKIAHIILAGDIFDGERPLKADREFFYNLISASPEICFYYLRGNHDTAEDYSQAGLENLKTFTDEWSTYELDGGVTISGCEITDGNCRALYQTLKLDKKKTNIVTLHGQAAAAKGAGLIHLPSLAELGIDYLALGHIHSYSSGRLDARGTYAYSGCLEGRGFDECGKKGFVLIDTDGGAVSHSFIPFACREIKSFTVDAGLADGSYSLLCLLRECDFLDRDIVRFLITGECDFDLTGFSETALKALEPCCFFARVKNTARKRLELTEAERELSLRGEFIRTVMRSNLTDAEKNEIINLGISALLGENL